MDKLKDIFLYLLLIGVIVFWVGIGIIAPVYLLYGFKKHQNLHKTGIITQAKVIDRKYRPSSHSLKTSTSVSRKLTYTYQVKNANNQLQTYTTRKEVSPYLYSKDEVDIYYCKNEVDFSDIVHNGMHYKYLGMFLFIFVVVWGFGVFLWCLYKNEQEINSVSKPKGFGIFFLGIILVCLLLFNDLRKAVNAEFGYAAPPPMEVIE
ncbi:MAG: hypothetical protein AB8B69_26020 [Chitinophagales bacterium]